MWATGVCRLRWSVGGRGFSVAKPSYLRGRDPSDHSPSGDPGTIHLQTRRPARPARHGRPWPGSIRRRSWRRSHLRGLVSIEDADDGRSGGGLVGDVRMTSRTSPSSGLAGAEPLEAILAGMLRRGVVRRDYRRSGNARWMEGGEREMAEPAGGKLGGKSCPLRDTRRVGGALGSGEVQAQAQLQVQRRAGGRA